MNLLRLKLDLLTSETQDTDAKRYEEAISRGVVTLAIVRNMIAVIDFNNQLSLSVLEIDNMNSNTVLPAKVHIASARLRSSCPE